MLLFFDKALRLILKNMIGQLTCCLFFFFQNTCELRHLDHGISLHASITRGHSYLYMYQFHAQVHTFSTTNYHMSPYMTINSSALCVVLLPSL